MQPKEETILKDFFQGRIEDHHRQYLTRGENAEVKALRKAYDQYRAEVFDKLPPEQQTIMLAFEEATFIASGVEEAFLFAAGFQDGLRVSKLLREMESAPLAG